VQLINHIPNSPNSLTNNEVNEVLEDAKGNLWFATSNGISRWNPVTDTWTSLYQNHKDHAEFFFHYAKMLTVISGAGTYASEFTCLTSHRKGIGPFSYRQGDS